MRVGCGAGTVACTHAGGSDTAVTAEDVEELSYIIYYIIASFVILDHNMSH